MVGYVHTCMHACNYNYLFFYFYQIRGMLLHDIYSKATKYALKKSILMAKTKATFMVSLGLGDIHECYEIHSLIIYFLPQCPDTLVTLLKPVQGFAVEESQVFGNLMQCFLLYCNDHYHHRRCYELRHFRVVNPHVRASF